MTTDVQTCDVLIVGSGPGGIAAACAAAESGKRVVVVDAGSMPGGQIWRGGPAKATDHLARKWLQRFGAARVDYQACVQIVSAGQENELIGLRRGRSVKYVYGALILATGAREVFLPFPGWTTPGVMGAGGIQAAVKSGLDIRGKRVVIAGTGPLLIAVGASLKDAGATIVAIVEQAPKRRLMGILPALIRNPGKLFQAVRYQAKILGTPYMTHGHPALAEQVDAGIRLTVQSPKGPRQLECDYVACGFHLTPNLELPRLLGCEISEGVVVTDQAMVTSRKGVYAIGELLGIGGVESALIEGLIAGYAATGDGAKASRLTVRRTKARAFADAMNRTFSLGDQFKTLPTEETIVCRCEDVTHGELKHRTNWREAKLYTRCGMGPCQGRICGTATSHLYGWTQETTRPPLFPVPATFWTDTDDDG